MLYSQETHYSNKEPNAKSIHHENQVDIDKALQWGVKKQK